MNVSKKSQLFLIVFTIISILCFTTMATAQELKNRRLSPAEAKALGYDTGNPPGPYWKSGPDTAAGAGVYELNGKDGPQPPNGPGYAGVGCDSRQDPRIFSGKAMWERGGGNRFDSSGKCTRTNTSTGKTSPCCVNIDPAGYPLPPEDPRYEFQDFQKKACEDLDAWAQNRPMMGPPGSPMARMEKERMQKVCDALAQRGNAPPAGNDSGMPPMGNDLKRRFGPKMAFFGQPSKCFDCEAQLKN